MLISMAFAIDVNANVGNATPVISEGSIMFCDGTCSSTKSVDPATDLTVSVEITDPNGQADIDASTLALIISSSPSSWDRVIASPVSHGTRDGCVEDGNVYCLQVDTTDWTTKFVAGVTTVTIDVSDVSAEPATQAESSGLTINATVGISNDATSGAYSGQPASTDEILTSEAKTYITTTHNGNVDLNVTVTATAFSDAVHTDIPVGAQKWDLTGTVGSATPFTGSADLVNSTWGRGTNPVSATMDLSLWLDIPAGQPAGAYLGTLTYNSVATVA